MTRKTIQTYKNGRPTKAQLMAFATNSANADLQGDVYILEFSAPLGNLENPKGFARYYVGWALQGQSERRLQEHRAGQGASITRAAAQKGIIMTLVAVIPGTPVTEREIKNYGNTPKLVEQLRKSNSPYLVQ